jgi:hypothetical protein
MPAEQSFASRHGRQLLLGCVAVFMLPFIGAGINLLLLGIRAFQRHEANAIAPLLAGVLFTTISVSIFAGVLVATRSAARAAALQAGAPDQPWLWRPEWSARRIPDRRSATPVVLWVVAIFWNSVTTPVLLVLIHQWQTQPKPIMLVFLLFPLVGAGLIVGAIYTTLRRLKFGRSLCAIDRVPIEPGGSFHGEIEMRGDAVPEGGYRLLLLCVHRVTTGSGKNQSTRETPLWQTESRITAATAMRLATGGVRVPFSLTIPADARATDLRTSRDQIVWRLDASAEMPGIDYAASFELPVFTPALTADRNPESARS